MKIVEVSFEAVFNLGDYENEKIRLTAQLEEGETPEAIIPQLRKKTVENASISGEESYNRRWKLEAEVRELENKAAKAREEWNAVAEFLRTQGLKPDAPSLTAVQNLLPQAQEEKTTVVTGELEF